MRIRRDFSVERLIRNLREIKVFLKHQNNFDEIQRLKIAMNPEMVIDLDKPFFNF